MVQAIDLIASEKSKIFQNFQNFKRINKETAMHSWLAHLMPFVMQLFSVNVLVAFILFYGGY